MEPSASSLLDPGAPRQARRYVLLWLLTVILLLLPVWWSAYTPLVDLPFHLARAYVLRHYQEVPFFQSVFERSLEPLPNLAVDLFVPPLLGWVDVVTAGKLFLSCYLLLFAWGCHALALAVHGRPSWVSPLLAFTAYNSALLWGFVNFVFGLAAALVTFALWLRWRDRQSLLTFLALTGLTFLVYLCHLAAWGVLGVSITSLTLWRCGQQRRLALRHCLPFALFVPGTLAFLSLTRNKMQLGVWGWSTPWQKLIAMGSVFLGYELALDAALAVLLGTVVLILLLRARWEFSRACLLAGGMLLLTFLVLPRQLVASGGGSADVRLFPAALLLLVASVSWRLPRRLAAPLYVAALVALAGRVVEIGWSWARISGTVQEGLAVVAQIPPEARFAMIVMSQPDPRIRAMRHIGAYAVARQHAIPASFCAWQGEQPIFYRRPQDWEMNGNPDHLDPDYLQRHLPKFDNVLGCHLDEAHRSWLSAHHHQVVTRGAFTLWKVAKASHSR